MTTDAAPRLQGKSGCERMPGRKWTMASSSLMKIEIPSSSGDEKRLAFAAFARHFAKLHPFSLFQEELVVLAVRHDFRARQTSYKLDRRIINGF